jgi:hypothetical protein
MVTTQDRLIAEPLVARLGDRWLLALSNNSSGWQTGRCASRET